MFTGFNENTLKFFELMEISNSRETFKSNEALYTDGIKIPLEELYFEMLSYFSKKGIEVSPNKHRSISSPYNDARFCGDRPMKEYIYVRFKEIKAEKANNVGFFFDASNNDYRFGINIYNLDSIGMEKIRRHILCNRELAENMIHDFNRQGDLKLEGDKYKKELYKEETAPLREWLNMKTMRFCHEEKINDAFTSRAMFDNIVKVFDKAVPIFLFLKEALQ